MRYAIVIPVLDQLHYTQQCINSLLNNGVPAESLLVIDNASRDDTPAWLASRSDIRSIRNPVNLGCGGAWTQGAFAATNAEWVVFLNNDIVVAHNAIEAMLDAAERLQLEVVSPALVEIELDYDLRELTRHFETEMRDVVREGWFHGVAFAVRQDVFHRIGYLDTDRLLFGREDAEFLFRCKRHGVRVGTVGAALIHHFGSITQSAMKRERQLKKFGDHRYLYGRLGMGWWERQRYKVQRKKQTRAWSQAELRAHAMTLHMMRRDGRWGYR